MVFKFLSLTFSFHSLCYIYFSLMLSWLGNLSIYFCYLPFALYLYTFFSSVALWIILLFLFLDSPCAEICIVNYCKTVIVQYCCCNLYIFIVSSRVGTPPFLREPPLSEANLKSYPSFWEPSKLAHVNCKKHFKNEGVMFRTILSQLRMSLTLLFLFSGSTLYLLLTFPLARYCL